MRKLGRLDEDEADAKVEVDTMVGVEVVSAATLLSNTKRFLRRAVISSARGSVVQLRLASQSDENPALWISARLWEVNPRVKGRASCMLTRPLARTQSQVPGSYN